MPKTQLQQLIDLDVSFAVVHADSMLGASLFFVLLDRDCRKHNLREFSGPVAGIRQKTLSSLDVVTLNRLKTEGAFTEVSLGEHGTVYELKGKSFRDYYHHKRTTPIGHD